LANYNKTIINIGHQHDRWVELKEALLRVQTHTEVPSRMYLEIGICIINDAGGQDVHKKQRKYTFFGRISPNDLLYSCFEGIY